MSKKQAALKRWDILAEVIKSKNCKSDVNGSKRSFQSYNIVKIEPVDDDTIGENDAEGEWKLVSYQDVSVKVGAVTTRLLQFSSNPSNGLCIGPL